LTCGFPGLRFLCTVISRKTQHSCKDTKMATPLDFCWGMSWPVNWYCLILRHVIRHVVNMRACKQTMRAFILDLSLTSFHSGTVGFAILCSQRWILVNINASTVAFIEIWENFPGLFCTLPNTTLNCLGFGMLIVGTAIFWLHLLISSSRDRYMQLSLYPVKYFWNRWKKIHESVPVNQGTANYVNTVDFIHHGKYANQSHRVCLRWR